jgi:hypothetical protein
MDIAVGGTNGWFPEAQGDKPWLDASDRRYHFLLGFFKLILLQML